MIALQEITKWAGNTPNHIYIVEDFDKLVAYIPAGTRKPIQLKKWLRFSRHGREFREVNLKNLPKPKHIVTVKGSTGQNYQLDLLAQKCSCPGFTYRGHCKHLEKAK